MASDPTVRVLTTASPSDLTPTLASLTPDELVVAVPPGPLELVARGSELVAAWEAFGADLVLCDDGVIPAMGRAGALAALVDGRVVAAEVDEAHELLHAATPDDERLVRLDDAWVYLPTGAVPAVIVGQPAEPPWADRLRAVLSPPPAEPTVPEVVAEAGEILRLALWPPERCQDLIELAEAHGGWGSDPTDPVPGEELSLAAVTPLLLAALEDELDRRVVPALRRHWPHFAWCGVYDAFVIRYRARGPVASSDLPLHHDVAQISASIRLDDDYEGGALAFPRQGYDTAGVAVGDLVAWPSLVTHPHRGEPVTVGVKHALTIWFALPET